MGKGDSRSRRGKIYQGSFGKSPPEGPGQEEEARRRQEVTLPAWVVAAAPLRPRSDGQLLQWNAACDCTLSSTRHCKGAAAAYPDIQ